MDWNTYYNFPVAYRYWLVERINKEISRANAAGNDIPTKGAHHHTPDIRALTGKARPMVPAKLRRF